MGNIRCVNVHGRTIEVEEADDTTDPETGKSLTGAWVWDSALVISHWLAYEPAWPAGSFTGLNVLELGAGIGLPGLVLAGLGANVVLADRKALLPAIRRNIERNGLEDNATAVEVEWGDAREGLTDLDRRSKGESEAANLAASIAARPTDGQDVAKAADDLKSNDADLDTQSSGQRQLAAALRDIEIQSRLILESQSLSASHDATAKAAIQLAGSGDVETGRITSGEPSEASEKYPAASSSSAGGTEDRERGGGGGEGDTFKHPEYDIIMGSDVTYDVNSMEDLAKTMKRFMGPKTRIFLGVELRTPTPNCFLVLAENGFAWEQIPTSQLHPDWSSDDIRIFRFYLKA